MSDIEKSYQALREDLDDARYNWECAVDEVRHLDARIAGLISIISGLTSTIERIREWAKECMDLEMVDDSQFNRGYAQAARFAFDLLKPESDQDQEETKC